jgi:hypothetical protein
VTHVVDPTLSPLHADVYEAIREAWELFDGAPSQLELQRACRCSGTSIQNAFRELRRRGWLLAPKFGYRVCKPTDMERTVSTLPPDPWEDLTTGPRFWVPPQKEETA